MRYFLNILFVFSFFGHMAQSKKDSLENIIQTGKDSAKINALFALSNIYYKNDTVNNRITINKMLELSVKSKNVFGISQAFSKKAQLILKLQGSEAAYACLKGMLPYIDTIKPNIYLGTYYLTLSNIYLADGNADLVMKNSINALKVYEKLNDYLGIARAYHGLSALTTERGSNKSFEYGLKALENYILAKDVNGEISMQMNLGVSYLKRAFSTNNEKDGENAFKHLSKSAEKAIQTNDDVNLAASYSNLGALFGFKKEYKKSLDYCRKALVIRKKLGNKISIASTLTNIGHNYSELNQKDSAVYYTLEALKYADEIGAPYIQMGCYEQLYLIYQQSKEADLALKYHKLFKTVSDELQNQERMKSLQEIETKFETEQKDKEIIVLNQLQKAKDTEISHQKIINYLIASGLIVVILFSAFLGKIFIDKKKAHKLLKAQNELINEKNRNITDSINYAKIIQSAVLPNDNEFLEHFKNGFILFKPKDIVSGDFYWFTQNNSKKIITVADCTGHGVPGAFMSMIGISFLNEIVNENEITNPAEILGLLRYKIKTALKQKDSEKQAQDGMDMALLTFDEHFNTVEFAGANNPLWILKKGENMITEFKPDKKPVGYYHGETLPFTKTQIPLQKGDALYIFTDGIADQFGGPKGKKFKYKQLKQILIDLKDASMQEQKTAIENYFQQWKGDIEQTDDICIIGLKV
ncbi:MAG: SpoIIE family protein phosphatase [Sphingobacteriaceae bacterium]|nr:SpoIIE family protein phosphatase [Sphingobacteriaceae bacterium]